MKKTLKSNNFIKPINLWKTLSTSEKYANTYCKFIIFHIAKCFFYIKLLLSSYLILKTSLWDFCFLYDGET